jgi:hypothetical protein
MANGRSSIKAEHFRNLAEFALSLNMGYPLASRLPDVSHVMLTFNYHHIQCFVICNVLPSRFSTFLKTVLTAFLT